MLYESAYFSIAVQVITGIIDIFGINIPIPETKRIFKDLLKVELGVQVVELIFYVWMVRNLTKVSNITQYRYFDWLVTTPTMLITLMAYLDTSYNKDLITFVKNNKDFILTIVVLNVMMLAFGLAAERNIIDYKTGVYLGFIPFVYYFKLIYDKYINEKSTKDQKFLYWFFFVVWSLYGVAALLPYEEKNTSYNILDLFAKNAFGIFLVFLLYNYRLKNVRTRKLSDTTN